MATDVASFLPFKADYAKSARASCKFCSSIIIKDALRLASVTISTRFEGQMVRWYHYSCFFEKNRPKSHLEIEGFDELRWEDQESIKKKLESSQGTTMCNCFCFSKSIHTQNTSEMQLRLDGLC